jgi:hypothetical protein
MIVKICEVPAIKQRGGRPAVVRAGNGCPVPLPRHPKYGLLQTGTEATMRISTSIDRITHAFIDQVPLVSESRGNPSNRPAAH